jgi:hypothetical protein
MTLRAAFVAPTSGRQRGTPRAHDAHAHFWKLGRSPRRESGRLILAFVQLSSLSDLEELLQRRLPGDVVTLEIGAVRLRLCPSAVRCLA